MQDKTITSALCQRRLQLIRSGQTLDHVDALLVQRGVNPASLHVPRYPADSCRHGEIRLAVIGELQTGPKTASQLVTAFHALHPDMALATARTRVHRSVYKMGRAGMAIRTGMKWALSGLAPNPSMPNN